MLKLYDTKKENDKTNKKMMVLSCIGIILVVLGHTNNQFQFANNFFPIYSFHMALFIFISGYFYNKKYESGIFKKDGFVLKNIKRLVIPYFIWNLFYGIVINLLRYYGVVNYGSEISLFTLFVKPWTTGHQYILNIPSWFMLSLFLVKIFYMLVRKVLTKIRLWNDYIFLFIFAVAAIFAIYVSRQTNLEIYIPILRTLFFTFFYHFGYMYKEYIEGKFKINSVLYLIGLILINLFLIKIDNTLTYEIVFMKFSGSTIYVPFIASITGILFYLKISEVIEPVVSNNNIVKYIGNNTYTVMMHHFFWILVTNIIIIGVAYIFNLSGFNIDEFKNNIFYFYTPGGVKQCAIIYSIIALSMPLVFKKMYTTVITKIYNNDRRKQNEI